MSANYYDEKYFDSDIFNIDYDFIAEVIFKQYAPSSVIEFGCGNGQLSKAFGKRGIKVTAIDGFANPDFSKYETVNYHRIDLNDPSSLTKFIKSQSTGFDVAICMEVGGTSKPAGF